MPTLGEFIVRARAYGYTKHVIRIRELGTRIVYLRRGGPERAELVELPPMRESDAVVETKDLDENTQIDLDRAGNICAITIEHAKERADLPHFSFEEVGS